MKPRSTTLATLPDNKLEIDAALIERLQIFELRSDQNGILSNDSYSPARTIDPLQCNDEIRNTVESQFSRLFAGKISDHDGIVLKCMDSHIATCVKRGLITDAAKGRTYMIEMFKLLLEPITIINNTDEATLPKLERDTLVTAYSVNLETNLARLFEVKENIMSGLPITLFHPTTINAMQKEGLTFPDPSSLLQSAQAYKNRISSLLIKEGLNQELSATLINKYERMSKLIIESINILNSYQAQEPINPDKLKAIAELANALQTLCNLPDAVTNIESITPITNQLRSNLLTTYVNILQVEKNLNPAFVAKPNSTLAQITIALENDEKLVPSQIRRISVFAQKKPTIKPEESKTLSKEPSAESLNLDESKSSNKELSIESQKIFSRLTSAPSTTTVFHATTQSELIKRGINHPAQTFLAEVQSFNNNRAAQFLTEGSTNGFSNELTNKYIRLNTLMDESLKLVNSYQAKQPVNIEKLKAVAELANSLQNIATLPPSEITSEKITSVTNQLRENLSSTYDNILKAEQNKSLLSGFVAKASSSTLGNIKTVLKEDEKLMSPETKKAFISMKEKPIVNSETLAKSPSSFKTL